MKTRMVSKRAAFRLLAAVCAVLILAAPAAALSRRNPGISGVWQDWGDGVWEYYYHAGTDCEYWRFKRSLEVRFAYKCTPGQWWQNASNHGGLFAIGHGGVTNDFLGDDTYNHVVDRQWSFTYRWRQDCAYWIDTSDNETRFAYKYGPGQWWDYTTQWGHLGLGALTTANFIGDGDWHTFDTANMAGGNYLGYTADADFRYSGGAYYWRCAGIERYKFVYGAGYTGSWYYADGGSTWYSMTYGSWENPDARYHGGGMFIESGLVWDMGANRPSSVPSPRNIVHNVFYVGGGSWDFQTRWTINNPGSDNRWSGGDLNMLWCNTRYNYSPDTNRTWAPTLSGWWNDFSLGYAEQTVPDVIVFLADFAQNPIGFDTMVDWMTIARDFFRKQIRTVQVVAHGNTTGWQMGEWMSTSNYTSFQNDWLRWRTLMTTDAQLISMHCQVGNATTMLNNIAAWSGCDIYANTNKTWSSWKWVTTKSSPEYFDSSYWNHNIKDIVWRDNSKTSISRTFEYRTSTAAYRWLLDDVF